MVEELGPLDRMTIEAHSPDGMITAVLSRRTNVELQFRPRAYERYSTDALGAQLAQLATRVWVGYRRGYFQALSAARGMTITGNEPVHSPREQQFKQDQAALEIEGTSPGGWVTVRSVGLMRWQVRVREGATRSLREREFLAEADAALRDLLQDYFDKVRQLQVKYFNLRLPETQTQTQTRVQPRARNGWR